MKEREGPTVWACIKFCSKPDKPSINSELGGEEASVSASFECQRAWYKANWDAQKLPCAFPIASRQDVQYLSQLGSAPADESAGDTRHQWWYVKCAQCLSTHGTRRIRVTQEFRWGRAFPLEVIRSHLQLHTHSGLLGAVSRWTFSVSEGRYSSTSWACVLMLHCSLCWIFNPLQLSTSEKNLLPSLFQLPVR